MAKTILDEQADKRPTTPNVSKLGSGKGLCLKMESPANEREVKTPTFDKIPEDANNPLKTDHDESNPSIKQSAK